MWQSCHFESNPEWAILSFKGKNVNIVKSRINGETCISQYLVIHVIKRIRVKVVCVSSPGWCVACFDLKTLIISQVIILLSVMRKNIQVEKLISYHISFATWITGYYENTRQSFLCRFPGVVCPPVLVQACLKTLNKGTAANVCLLLEISIYCHNNYKLYKHNC